MSLVIAISKTVVIFFHAKSTGDHHPYIETFFFFFLFFFIRVLSQNDNRVFEVCISLFHVSDQALV